MEGHHHHPDHSLEISMVSGGSGHGASRWNPTKEQIDLLEGLYKQGLRTPSAQEIQQITGRLREYGHIEGKNVFYWFQNHKARQRQKQKQSKNESVSYANRFILPNPPANHVIYQPPHYPAGVCNPVCMPYPEIGLYNQQQQQQPRLLLPRPVKRRPPPLLPAPAAGGPTVTFQPPYAGRKNYYYNDSLIFSPGKGNEESKETLELFPMQPSGNLLSPNSSSDPTLNISLSNFPAGSKRVADQKRQIQGIPATRGGGGDRAFFDFLCGSNGSSCDR